MFKLLSLCLAQVGISVSQWPNTPELGSIDEYVQAFQCMYNHSDETELFSFAVYTADVDWFDTYYAYMSLQINASNQLGWPTVAFIYNYTPGWTNQTAQQCADDLLDNLSFIRVLTNQTIYYQIQQNCSFFWDQFACFCPNITWAQEFYQEIATRLGVNRVGVMTDPESWSSCVGTSQFDEYQLMYIGNDVNSYSDFTAFGGWYAPNMKMTKHGLECNCTIDGMSSFEPGYGVVYMQ